MGIIRLTAQSVNKSNLLHRFHHHNNIKHKTRPVLFTDSALWAGLVMELPSASVCMSVCVSVPSQDTHFRRLKKVLDKEHIANFGLWWHTFCFFASFRFHDFFFFCHSFRLYSTIISLSYFFELCVHSHLTIRTVRTAVVPHRQCPASCLLEIIVCICLSACRHPSLEILKTSSQLQLPLPDT